MQHQRSAFYGPSRRSCLSGVSCSFAILLFTSHCLTAAITSTSKRSWEPQPGRPAEISKERRVEKGRGPASNYQQPSPPGSRDPASSFCAALPSSSRGKMAQFETKTNERGRDSRIEIEFSSAPPGARLSPRALPDRLPSISINQVLQDQRLA